MNTTYFYLQARAFFQAAYMIAPHMYEPHYNWAQLADQVCDWQLMIYYSDVLYINDILQ